jgi:adenine-specific DNA-methyltransferase
VPSVSVLYINDDVVGPHLQLIRNICEPNSRSRPHVTVRYSDKLPIPEAYHSANIGYIDLVEPGAFGLDQGDESPNRTVYIRCESDALLHLDYKPHFPTSEFHITLYDGRSSEFARQLLLGMKQLRWGFRLLLPNETTLTQIEIKTGKSGLPKPPPTYSPQVHDIFYEVSGQRIDHRLLQELSDSQRVELAVAVAQHMHQHTAYFPQIASIRQLPKQPGTSPQGNSWNVESEIHLTPPELAVEITSYTMKNFDLDHVPLHFGDPAVGTGAFYAALLRVMGERQVESAIGIDINPKQIAAARWRWESRGMQVMEGDYLHMERLPLRTLILANPPYLRHQGIPPAYKRELRERASVLAGMKVSGLSGLYVYFMLLSHAWMAPNALAAWLVPSEFMQTDYGAVLRYYLTHKVQLIRVHRFSHDHPQFENAMVLPSVVVFRNCLPDGEHEVLFSSGGTLSRPITTENVATEQLRRDERWTIPRCAPEDNQYSPFRIGDLFTVQRGIATGANDFFIIERGKAAKLGLPKEALRPVLPKARSLIADIVDGDSDGYPIIEPQLCLLDCALQEHEIRDRYPKLMDYLASAEHKGIRERTLVRKRRLWYKQEHRLPPPFLCTYMGRGPDGTPPIRFIWNRSQAVATNTYLLLYPKPRLASLLADERIEGELFELLRETAQTVMKSGLRVHADGLQKIEPGELVNVRLAFTPSWIAKAVDSDLLSPLRPK